MLKNVTDTVFYVGVDDKDIDLFENQYIVPNGMAYNSYVIMDEKIAIMDMVDAKCADQWFANVAEVLGDRQPDYLIISHLEPDHSANLGDVLAKYPDIKIVSNAKLFGMLPNFFEVPVADRIVTVAEGQTLSLGSHTLQFFMAPMVHWPEVCLLYTSPSPRDVYKRQGHGHIRAEREDTFLSGCIWQVWNIGYR